MSQPPSPLPPQHLKPLLRERLKSARSVALLCVGAELRGDDGVGMRIGRILDARPEENGKLRVHYGSSAPENCTGPIRTQAPSHLVIIDAAHLGGQPGDVALLEREHITGASFCTHALPLNVIVDFIAASNPQLQDVLLIGIQPEAMGFDEPLTARIEQVAQDVANTLREAVSPSQPDVSHDSRDRGNLT